MRLCETQLSFNWYVLSLCLLKCVKDSSIYYLLCHEMAVFVRSNRRTRPRRQWSRACLYQSDNLYVCSPDLSEFHVNADAYQEVNLRDLYTTRPWKKTFLAERFTWDLYVKNLWPRTNLVLLSTKPVYQAVTSYTGRRRKGELISEILWHSIYEYECLKSRWRRPERLADWMSPSTPKFKWQKPGDTLGVYSVMGEKPIRI